MEFQSSFQLNAVRSEDVPLAIATHKLGKAANDEEREKATKELNRIIQVNHSNQMLQCKLTNVSSCLLIQISNELLICLS